MKNIIFCIIFTILSASIALAQTTVSGGTVIAAESGTISAPVAAQGGYIASTAVTLPSLLSPFCLAAAGDERDGYLEFGPAGHAGVGADIADIGNSGNQHHHPFKTKAKA